MRRTVKKSDYEIYTFNIPLRLRGKRRDAFITRELEKKHPCFSQQCCYDSRLKLHKGKLQSLVAVMDKLKLLEYKGKSKNGISLEGIKNCKFFDDNKRFFILACGFLLLTFIAVPCLLFNSKKADKVNPIENVMLTEENPPIEKNDSDVSATDFLETLFLKLAGENGLIENFSYSKENFSLDDFGVKISMNVKKIHPEKIDFTAERDMEKIVRRFSAVSYQDKQPSFSVDFSIPRKTAYVTAPLDLMTMAELRTAIEKKGSIKSELLDECGFSFSVEDRNLCGLFLDLADMLKNTDLDLKSLRVSSANGSHLLDMGFCINSAKEGKNVFLLFSDFWNLFCEKLNFDRIDETEKTLRKAVMKTPDKQNDESTKSNRAEKIGGIVTKDGRKISYYRLQDGKIRSVEE